MSNQKMMVMITLTVMVRRVEALGKIVRDKDMESLHRLGGIQGITAALETDAERGIDGDTEDFNRRREVLTHFLLCRLKLIMVRLNRGPTQAKYRGPW